MKKVAKIVGMFALGLLAAGITSTVDPVNVSLVSDAVAGSPCFDECVETNCKPIRESAPPYTNWARCVKACTYQCH